MKCTILLISLSIQGCSSLLSLSLRGLLRDKPKGLCLLNTRILLPMIRETTVLISIWYNIYYLFFVCFYLPLIFKLVFNCKSSFKKKKSLLKSLRLGNHLPIFSVGFCSQTLGALVLWIFIWLTSISMLPLRAPDNSITSSATLSVDLASLWAVILLITLSACTLVDCLSLAHQTCWKLAWIAHLGTWKNSISHQFSPGSHRLWCLHWVKITKPND